MRHKLRIFIVALLAVTLVDCTSIGTTLLPKNREGFNHAMITSEEQQLLLNLVRIQFEDRPYFVSVDNITTSNSISTSAAANYSYSPSPSSSTTDTFSVVKNLLEVTSETITNSFSLSQSVNISPSITYTDSPTTTFSPLQGEKFTRQTLTPITIDQLYLLLSSSWNPERVFRVLLERIGDLHNESDVSHKKIPEFKRFDELAQLIGELQEEEMIYFHKGVITHVSVNLDESESSNEKPYQKKRRKKSTPRLPVISAQNATQLPKLKTSSIRGAQ